MTIGSLKNTGLKDMCDKLTLVFPYFNFFVWA